MEQQPGALLQGSGKLRPRKEGRGEPAGQLAPLLPRSPHIHEPFFEFQRLRFDLAGPFQHYRVVPVQVLQQARVVQQAVVKDQSFDVGSGEEGHQLVLDALPHFTVTARKVHRLDELLHPATVGDSRKLFSGRNDVHPVGGGHRPLAQRVELPDGVHLVVPKLNAKGQVGIGREDVYDPAALAECSRGFHHWLVAIA